MLLLNFNERNTSESHQEKGTPSTMRKQKKNERSFNSPRPRSPYHSWNPRIAAAPPLRGRRSSSAARSGPSGRVCIISSCTASAPASCIPRNKPRPGIDPRSRPPDGSRRTRRKRTNTKSREPPPLPLRCLTNPRDMARKIAGTDPRRPIRPEP